MNTGKWYAEPRDLAWLRKPISFNRPQVGLQRGCDWSYRKDGILTIIQFMDELKLFLLVTVLINILTAHGNLAWLSYFNHAIKWYLHISATKEMLDFDKQQVKHVVEIDRRLRLLATIYDKKDQTAFFDGKAVMHKRAKYQKLRAELQAKGTKSAKRRLKNYQDERTVG